MPPCIRRSAHGQTPISGEHRPHVYALSHDNGAITVANYTPFGFARAAPRSIRQPRLVPLSTSWVLSSRRLVGYSSGSSPFLL